VLNDQSSIYADLAGPGSVVAARLAVEDAGGTVLGRPAKAIRGQAFFSEKKIFSFINRTHG